MVRPCDRRRKKAVERQLGVVNYSNKVQLTNSTNSKVPCDQTTYAVKRYMGIGVYRAPGVTA